MNNHQEKYEAIRRIMTTYDRDDRVVISTAYGDGGATSPFPRLERAATNQMEDGLATVSRYGIWANTVRDNLREALRHMEQGDPREATRLLSQSINALSAFADIQAICDPLRTD